jgi:ferredoxin--NADP+ reductase
MTRPLRVAIVGAGPAGIYAGNILNRQVTEAGGEVAIDLYESLPAPYGLIRYGVAPDHPRIKGIVNSLHEMLDAGTTRFIGNVEVGRDIALDELQERYDAVIIATGAIRDAALDIPGIDLPGSYGAADFVAWFDGHPDVPTEWTLDQPEVAVIGNGNVALDVARILAKHAVDLRSTEIADNVLAGLEASAVTDVHVFGRRGPADIKFTPIELRELGEVPNVDIVVHDEDFIDADPANAANNQLKVMLRVLTAGARARRPAPAAVCTCTSTTRPSRCSATARSRASASSAPSRSATAACAAPASSARSRCSRSTAPSATTARRWSAPRSTSGPAWSRTSRAG